MKTYLLAFACLAANFASAQLLPHYDRTGGGSPFGGACAQGSSSRYEMAGGQAAFSQPRMHAEERSGLTSKEMIGDGSGTMFTMQGSSWSSTSFGIMSGSYYMMRAGASVIPVFAQVRQNFATTRSDGIFGAIYGYAAGGPAVGIGQSMFTQKLSDFLHSLTFRVGAGAMAGVGAELGGRAFGWSTFTELGVIGMAFTAKLGPQQTYAAPFFAFGLRRALGN